MGDKLSDSDTIKIFIEISVGGVSKDQLLQSLADSGIKFNEYAKALFAHPLFFPEKEIQKVCLAKTNLSDLKLQNPCSFQEIVSRASRLGLRPCPLFFAAHIRLEYLGQPESPHLTIVSEKPEYDESFPTGFYVRNTKGSLWLRGYRAEGDCEWPEGNEFIFLK